MVAFSTLLKIASWNICTAPVDQDPRIPTDPNAEAPWIARRDAIADQILWEMPDIIGLQEVESHQLSDMSDLLRANYDFVGVGRDDGQSKGEAVPVFFRKDNFELVDAYHFWLSEEPDKPGSKSWGAAYTRMATVATLATCAPAETRNIIESDYVFVVNTHFDNESAEARRRGAQLILDRLRQNATSEGGRGWGGHGWKRSLLILIGDLNSEEDDGAYQTLTGGRYGPRGDQRNQGSVADGEGEGGFSFLDTAKHLADGRQPFGARTAGTGFGATSKRQNIDHILVADNGLVRSGAGNDDERAWKVSRYGILPNRVEDGYYAWRASDHNTVVTTLEAERSLQMTVQ